MKCAFELGNKCVALTTKECEGCNFRKTQAEIEKGRKKAKKRFNSLPEELQTYIKEKYFLRREK